MRRDILETLARLGKPFYTVAELRRVTGLAAGSLRVFLSRWTKAGWLGRAGTGLYRLPDQPLDPAVVANQRYFPSYLSFESALSRHGIISQIPYVLTFAAPRRSRRLRLTDTEVEYRQLKIALYFGYRMQAGIYVATPEKALLDQLYFVSLGRASLDLRELNLKPVKASELRALAKRFPDRVQRLAQQLPFQPILIHPRRRK
jgi:predicted transcriptional regulator of viral defense system